MFNRVRRSAPLQLRSEGNPWTLLKERSVQRLAWERNQQSGRVREREVYTVLEDVGGNWRLTGDAVSA